MLALLPVCLKQFYRPGRQRVADRRTAPYFIIAGERKGSQTSPVQALDDQRVPQILIFVEQARVGKARRAHVCGDRVPKVGFADSERDIGALP